MFPKPDQPKDCQSLVRFEPLELYAKHQRFSGQHADCQNGNTTVVEECFRRNSLWSLDFSRQMPGHGSHANERKPVRYSFIEDNLADVALCCDTKFNNCI